MVKVRLHISKQEIRDRNVSDQCGWLSLPKEMPSLPNPEGSAELEKEVKRNESSTEVKDGGAQQGQDWPDKWHIGIWQHFHSQFISPICWYAYLIGECGNYEARANLLGRHDTVERK